LIRTTISARAPQSSAEAVSTQHPPRLRSRILPGRNRPVGWQTNNLYLAAAAKALATTAILVPRSKQTHAVKIVCQRRILEKDDKVISDRNRK
jgi:hypothetical protein